MPMGSEPSISEIRLYEAGSALQAAWSWLVEAIDDCNLIVVLAFCVVGLLASVCFIHYVPDFGATAEPINRF